ncbi:50S ribosomal protein L10 [Oceanispirochaeta sp.]|jgi:large subunit ribosomal protein L10|uniref:50S ribosomal protein L10 n=1 Tax=Oceanispirochaeta sp. TaxID=2035350 RepID=UPI002635D8E5|nr:50S ribosomal protein L10 [Oceanispirochaeta sp.]MDA3958450.1 50S ribosomal protein L10 [Oceanispirochaeta sp.]
MADKKIQQSKIDAVKALKEQFDGVNSFFFTDYRGLTVEQVTILRAKLREQDAEYHVIKNNLAKIAMQDLGKDGLNDLLVGPTAVALAHDEAGPVAKTILDFGKKTTVTMKGGFLDGAFFDEAAVVAFSKLPTRTELIAKLMATMQAPVQNVAFVLNGVTTKLVRTLAAVAEQKGTE